MNTVWKGLVLILLILILMGLFFIWKQRLGVPTGGGTRRSSEVMARGGEASGGVRGSLRDQNQKQKQNRSQKPVSRPQATSATTSEELANQKYPYFKELDQNLRQQHFSLTQCFLKDRTFSVKRLSLRLQWEGSGVFKDLTLEPASSKVILECLKEVAAGWTFIKAHPGGASFSYQIQLVLF